MVKVAVISDIHGNYIALEEMLKDAKESGATKYIFTGDLINEFPFGNKVINQIKELQNDYDVYVVKGNREQYLIEYDEYKYTWENVQFKNTVFMRKELTDDNFEFIKNLPFVLSIKIEDLTFKLFHGSIYSLSEFIHNYDEDLMEKIANETEEKVLLFGHSHQRIWTKEAYELNYLAEFVDLRPLTTTEKEYGLGRNCSLFDTVRHWAYSAIREHRGKTWEQWLNSVLLPKFGIS